MAAQKRLEAIAEDVGKTVRDTMESISGQKPEDLPSQEDIRKVRLGLKRAGQIVKGTPVAEIEDKREPKPGEFLEPPEEEG